MIRVDRIETPATADDAGELVTRLDNEPGAWLGCDVSVEGLYRREAIACVDPALAFYLDGNILRIIPRTSIGQALAVRLRDLAPFEWREGRLEVSFGAQAVEPHPAIGLLRRFLALFTPARAELALYGAFAFDFYRLERGDAIPEDGRRRMALFFPERVLVMDESGRRWIEFRFPGLEPSTTRQPPPLVPPAKLQKQQDDHPPGGHAKAVALGVAKLERGELASLVLSQTFRRPSSTTPSKAFSLLREANPYPAMFFLNLGGGESLFGASPDLQVRADAQWIETAPVCGTARRGLDALDDYEQARGLLESEVDGASLAVCADSDRNDKARVCIPGSVEQVSHRRIHFFSTIIHAIAHNRGRRRADVDAFDILLAHTTPATVTGMPKRAAVAAIAEIEPGWRGWYAGAAVRIGSDGSLNALTMLRFARIVDGIAEVRVGGSLLADSDPAREEEETRLKAETLFRVLAGTAPGPQQARPVERIRTRIAFIDNGDPLAALSREALLRAGAEFDADAAIRVFGDGSLDTARAAVCALTDGPVLALNTAGLALLERDGATLERLSRAQFARSVNASVSSTHFLAGIGDFSAGVYATHCLRAHTLPEGWTACACANDGRILAAVHADGQHCVILFRPDSVLSSRRGAGVHVLAQALAWLAQGHPPSAR